jgi:hypothetical protein
MKRLLKVASLLSGEHPLKTTEPSQSQREELFRNMRDVVKSFGVLEGFRESDLEHDRVFLFHYWSGAPFVWVPYKSGTHLLSLAASCSRKQRIILNALATIDLNFDGVRYFLARPHDFALQPFSRDALRDEVIAQLDSQSRVGTTHGACQP